MLLHMLTLVPLIWTSLAAEKRHNLKPQFCGFSKSNLFLDEEPLPPCSDPSLTSFKKDSRSVMGNAVHPDGIFPSWINFKLARKGQKLALDNLGEIGTSHLYGLLSSTYYDGTLVLMFTGEHTTVEKVAKRYFVTLTQILMWYQDPIFDTNSSDIITSLSRVRSIHMARAEAAAIKQNESGRLIDDDFYSNYTMTTALSGPFFEDLNESDIPPEQRALPPSQWTNISKPIVPFNQQIQALTQFAFVAYPVLFPERIGLESVTDDQLWAYNHLWAVLGYAIGIKDEFNIALQPDLATARKVYKDIWEGFNVPNLFNMNEQAKKMIELILLGNVKISNGLVHQNYLLYRMLTDLFAIEAPNTFKTLPKMYKFLAKQRKTKLASNHKRTPIEEIIHGSLNYGIWSGVWLQGMDSYGPEYAEQEYRANHVHIDE